MGHEDRSAPAQRLRRETGQLGRAEGGIGSDGDLSSGEADEIVNGGNFEAEAGQHGGEGGMGVDDGGHVGPPPVDLEVKLPLAGGPPRPVDDAALLVEDDDVGGLDGMVIQPAGTDGPEPLAAIEEAQIASRPPGEARVDEFPPVGDDGLSRFFENHGLFTPHRGPAGALSPETRRALRLSWKGRRPRPDASYQGQPADHPQYPRTEGPHRRAKKAPTARKGPSGRAVLRPTFFMASSPRAEKPPTMNPR